MKGFPGRRLAWRAVAALVGVVAVLAGVFALGRVTAPSAEPLPQPSVVEEPKANPLPVVGVEPVRQTVPVTFTPAPGLADDPGFAIGYAVDDTDIDRTAVRRFLARVFGPNGTLTVGDGPLVPWEFRGDVVVAGKQPDQDAAQRVVTSLLGQLGVDANEIDWQVSAASNTVTVTAWEKLDGRRTDLSWRVTLGPDSTVLRATGFAGTLQPTPAYPLLGAASAVTRSQQPGWAAFGPSPVLPAKVAAPEPTASASASFGRPIVVGSVRELSVTGAELGLAQHWQPDGTLLVVPSYLISADDGSEWTLLAVRDAFTRLQPPLPAPSPSAS